MFARRYQNKPVHIRVNDPDEGHTKADIKQFIYRAHALDKEEVVARILQSAGRGKTVIFTKTKRQAGSLCEALLERGFRATALYGDMSQEARERSMSNQPKLSTPTAREVLILLLESLARAIVIFADLGSGLGT